MPNANLFSQIGLLERLKERDNYDSWRISARAALELSGLWQYVSGELTEKDADKKVEGEMKAKAKLTLMVDPINYSHLQSAKTAKEIWSNLKAAFDDDGLMRRVGLLRTMINTRLESCSSMEHFVNTIITTAHKLKGAGMTVDDEYVATILQAGLGDDYKPMIMAIESSVQKITSDFVKTKLLQNVGSDQAPGGLNSNALYTKRYSGSGGNGRNGGNGGHGHTGGQGKSGSQGKSMKNVKCFECNQMGHYARQCPSKKKADSSSLFCLTANHAACDDWFIDSGASKHMTNKRDWMVNERTTSTDSVNIANNFRLPVQCMGDLSLMLDRGKHMSDMHVNVRDVLYVPGLCANLISVSQLVQQESTI